MSDVDILQMKNIDKSFNGVPVLKRANFSLRQGEIHALMGGNGAGKSTLMKILTGVYQRDGGVVLLDGEDIHAHSSRESERRGIAMIFQEFSLIPTLTVAQNIYLKHEPRTARDLLINDREAVRRSRELLESLGEDIDARAPVNSLSVGASQMVEIAKALSKNARILVMDEPTSSLSETETDTLFRLIRRLRSQGISIIYISHRMSEIAEICDRVTVMRDGTDVLTDETGNVSMERLIETMLGAETEANLTWKDRGRVRADAPILRVRNLKPQGHDARVDFEIYPGEIVGLAGLTGSGRTEIAEAVFGIRPVGDAEILVDDHPVRTTRDAIEAGVALVPEDRRRQGLVLGHTLSRNFSLPNLDLFTQHWFVRDRAARRDAQGFIGSLKIKTDGTEKVVRLLSGGNQQKVVLSKWLERRPRLLILDEPTIGVDIGAKSDIVEIVRSIADQGAGVLVISSEFEELLAMSDRLLILFDGQIIREMDRREVDSEEVLHHAVQG